MIGRLIDLSKVKLILERYSLVLLLTIDTSCFLSPNLRCMAINLFGKSMVLNNDVISVLSFVKARVILLIKIVLCRLV